jgi:hypothetical protein
VSIRTLPAEIKPKKYNMKNLIKLFSFSLAAGFVLTSCEGPMGQPGKDANESCTMCHNSVGETSVDSVKTQYEFSKHSYGEAAFEESGNTGCTPCHASEAFRYVVANNTPVTFTIPSGGTTYSNNYATAPTKAYGEITCVTCHNNLHTTFTDADFLPLTTTKPVPMTFNGGAKTIDLTQKGGESNLCVKCHQPRPFTRTFGDKNVIDYAALVSSPTTIFFDGNNPTSTANVNTIRPSYRTHTHYGTVGAVYAGKGGVEFGTGYTNSQHTSVASCQDCHMAPITGRTGGHTFFAKGNFNGCNVSGCHSSAPISSSTTTAYWGATRTEIQNLLNALAAKLTIGGVDILNRNPNSTENFFINVDYNLDSKLEDVQAGVNLWAGLTKNNYDGYLNIYDPSTNPLGSTYNASMFQNPSPSSSWNAAQTAYNLTLPKLVITNAQFGAIINFQLCLREYSLGIHNTKYVRTLLTNSIAAI